MDYRVQTKVGDHYILEEMLKNEYNFCGEQSEHLIFLDYVTTEDEMLSTVQFTNIVVEKGTSLANSSNEIPKYSQLLKKLRVEYKMMMTNINILNEIVTIEAKMNREGRVFVLPSVTKALVCIMGEAKTEKLCETYVNRLLNIVEKELA